MKTIIFPLVFGAALAGAGIRVLSWEFWVLMPLAAIWAAWPEKKKRSLK